MVLEISEHAFTFLKEKLIFALFPASLFILTASEVQLLQIIAALIVVDTVLGSIIGIKTRKFTSSKFSRVVGKIFIYYTTMLVALLVTKVQVPMAEFFFEYTGAFIVVTEAFSCFEKLSILGFPKAKYLLKKFNADFELMCDGDEEARERVLNRKSK